MPTVDYLVQENSYGREDWIDRWRGLLMLCIVAFHVAGALLPACTGEPKDSLTFFADQLATFHTRGFFVIAGMLWHPRSGFLEFLRRKVKRLLVPYFVFGFVWALMFAILGNRFCAMATTDTQACTLTFWKPFVSVLLADGWPDGVGFRVINVLWFLPCLFLVEIIYFWIDRIMPNKYWQIVLLPVCFSINGFVFKPDIFWCLNLVPRFIACFILGRVMFCNEQIKIARVVKILSAILLFILVCHPRLISQISTVFGLGQWSDFTRGMLGVAACAALAQALPSGMLGVVGRSTIGILVTHKVFVMLMQLTRIHIQSEYALWSVMLVGNAAIVSLSLLSTIGLRRWCPYVLGEFK